MTLSATMKTNRNSNSLLNISAIREIVCVFVFALPHEWKVCFFVISEITTRKEKHSISSSASIFPFVAAALHWSDL